MSTPLARVGMFGGAFDPPHRAHAALARAAVAQLQLDRLVVLPTGDAWHKQRRLTPANHRLEMTRLALGALPHVTVDDRELRRSGPTYSIDTLQELADEVPGARLHLVIGGDQAASFTTWREWPSILQLATLVVAERGDDAASEAIRDLQTLPGARVVRLQLPRMDVSATAIRARLTAGQDIADLVTPQVASYIARHHLYPNA